MTTWAEFVAECIPAPVTVSVQAYLGGGASGDQHAAAVDYGPCVVEAVGRTVVVQTIETQGEQRLSSTTVFGPPEPVIVPGSLVTAPGRDTAARVIAVARHHDHGIGAPSHQELLLE